MSTYSWFSAWVRLKDGSWVHLRPLRAADAAALRRLFHELSTDSRYHRFFGLMNELSPSMLRYLTDVDGERHVAIGAWVPEPGGERLVGVGRFVRSEEDPSAAEAAITVVDDMHRQGLGRRLLDALVDAARHRDVARLTFEVKRSNHAIRALVRGAGGKVRGDRGIELTFQLGVPPPSPLLVPLRMAVAQVAHWRRWVARL